MLQKGQFFFTDHFFSFRPRWEENADNESPCHVFTSIKMSFTICQLNDFSVSSLNAKLCTSAFSAEARLFCNSIPTKLTTSLFAIPAIVSVKIVSAIKSANHPDYHVQSPIVITQCSYLRNEQHSKKITAFGHLYHIPDIGRNLAQKMTLQIFVFFHFSPLCWISRLVSFTVISRANAIFLSKMLYVTLFKFYQYLTTS